jgi:hypothetical protein
MIPWQVALGFMLIFGLACFLVGHQAGRMDEREKWSDHDRR